MGSREVSTIFQTVYNQALDLIFPQRCVTCGKLGSVWCSDCSSQAYVIKEPYCRHCGTPGVTLNECIHCNTWQYNFDEARAWGKYSGTLRGAILSLKHRYNIQLGHELARFMAGVFPTQKWKVDLVVPIPLAPHRLAERGYNQAELLTKPFASLSRLTFAAKILHRSHETVKQFELDARQRWDNLLGAFQVDSHDLSGANILLVDDIMTTGATLNAAAVVLKSAGCSKVFALTLAKTLFNEE